MYTHSRKKIFVPGSIQSKNQILYELWNKGFILRIRPHIVVGAALKVKVQEKSGKWESQSWINLKSQTGPIKWEAVSLCSFCISGPPQDVWLWVLGCWWSPWRTGGRAEDIKDKLKTNQPPCLHHYIYSQWLLCHLCFPNCVQIQWTARIQTIQGKEFWETCVQFSEPDTAQMARKYFIKQNYTTNVILE